MTAASPREIYFFRHWRDCPPAWFASRWPNFSPKELACRHCGELKIDAASLDILQEQRASTGRRIILSSAYRCPIWNALVGGAPLSMHKFARAFDQANDGTPQDQRVAQARDSGFSGIGLYKTFVHTDTGRARQWGF